ncbi:sensor histidine kinase [Embleya sp. NPDC050493]|uniref:sensor histidine kinase n=1 Tax=Embleya sp. NPDC050493 TaxID=3363989 RepID=UPI0037B89488
MAARRWRPSRLTIRARLTLVYSVLFLIAGGVVLGATYLLVSQQLPDNSQTMVGGSPTGGVPAGGGLTGHGASGGTPAGSPPLEGQFTHATDGTRQGALDALLTQGGIALAAVGIAATLLGWLIAGRMLQPLHRMTETARRIAEAPAADRNLHERIGLDGPEDELRRLADTFDLMLERLDHSFDGQRRFIANASHELRTPLALNQALLEVVVFRRTASEEVRQLGETLLEINNRHERLIDGLLLLARSEHEVLERAFVDLADVVDHVVELASQGAVTIETETAEAATTGNPVLLERLVHNLVENGIRHNTPEGGWVRVTSRTGTDGSAIVEVANTGPAVARYEIPSLFEPFRRLGAERLATRAPGAGLGLSIVRAVARAHGGDVHAEPREGGGLTVAVSLPAAREPDDGNGDSVPRQDATSFE